MLKLAVTFTLSAARAPSGLSKASAQALAKS